MKQCYYLMNWHDCIFVKLLNKNPFYLASFKIRYLGKENFWRKACQFFKISNHMGLVEVIQII